MKKNFLKINFKIFTLLLTCLVILTSCGSDDIILAKKEVNWDEYYMITYNYFTGTRTREFTIEKDCMAEIGVMTTFGDLDIEIFGYDERGVGIPMFYGENLKTSVSSVMLLKGEYTLYAYGKGHCGGFSIEYLSA